MGSEHNSTTREYTRLREIPGLLGLYGKAAGETAPLIGTKRDGTSLPATGLEVEGVHVDVRNLADYTRACGLRLRDELPLTYPFTLTFPVAMALMTGPGFPFPAMGSVHLNNVIETSRALHTGEELSIRVHAENLREHPSGLLVDIVSEISARGESEPAWVQRSSFLSKRRTSLTPPKDAPRPEKPAAPTVEEVGDPTVVTAVNAAQISEYAAVSGDRNPIHVSSVGAKAFGFPNVIAHGMWTAAMLLGSVEGGYGERVRYSVDFGKPVVLPARVAVRARRRNPGWEITARDAKSIGTLHATGHLEDR